MVCCQYRVVLIECLNESHEARDTEFLENLSERRESDAGVSLMTIGKGIVGFPWESGAGKSTLIPDPHCSIKLIKSKRCDYAGR